MVDIHSGRHDDNLRHEICYMSECWKLRKRSKLTFNLLFPCSARRFWAVLTTLNNTSVWIVLSWASSRIMTLYLFRRGSNMASLSNIPSVRNLILVLKLDTSSKRTVYPTVVPSWAPISCATLVARVMAATLLGCKTFFKLYNQSEFIFKKEIFNKPEWLQ